MRPLTIPDDKITRWHPKFALDEVPDIEAAPLPEPPDVKRLATAGEVLAQTCGKTVNPRVGGLISGLPHNLFSKGT